MNDIGKAYWRGFETAIKSAQQNRHASMTDEARRRAAVQNLILQWRQQDAARATTVLQPAKPVAG